MAICFTSKELPTQRRSATTLFPRRYGSSYTTDGILIHILYWIGVVIPLAAYRRIYKYFENILMYGINPSVQQSMVLMSRVAKAVQTGNVQTYLYVFSAGIILITMLLLS